MLCIFGVFGGVGGQVSFIVLIAFLNTGYF